MAVTVVDKDNFLDQAQGKEIPAEREDDPETKPKETQQAAKAAKVVEKEPDKADLDNDTDLPDEDFALLTEKQQRAVNKKHRAMKEADEFAEEQYRGRKAAERRAEEAERKLAEREATGKPKQAEEKEPDPEKFKTADGQFDAFGYAKALAKFSAEEAVKADRETQAKLNKDAAEAKSYQEYLGRVRESAKAVPDWQEIAEGAADLQVSGAVTGYIRECDAPAPLLAHFAQHPDVLERLNALPTIKAISEVAKLELSLTKKEEPLVGEKPLVKKAPEPITPLVNGGGSVRKDPRDMSTQDHIEDEYRQAREESRARKRH